MKQTTIGFEAVKALLAGRVAARPRSGTSRASRSREQRPGIREFRVDAYGAPAYPELVLCVTRATLEDEAGARAGDDPRAPARLRARPSTTPRARSRRCWRAEPGLDRDALAAQLDAVAPLHRRRPRVRPLRPAVLRAWAAWDAGSGSCSEPLDVGARSTRRSSRSRKATSVARAVPEPSTVVVVGAGQAGLAVSHELERAGVEHVVLERGRVGAALARALGHRSAW